MPYELTWEAAGTYVTFTGDVTSGDMTGSVNEMVADPRFDRMRYRINDYREGAVLHISLDEMEVNGAISWATSKVRVRTFASLVAHITSDPAVMATIEKYYALNLSPYPFRIFPTEAAARAWIASETGPRR